MRQETATFLKRGSSNILNFSALSLVWIELASSFPRIMQPIAHSTSLKSLQDIIFHQFVALEGKIQIEVLQALQACVQTFLQ